MSIQGGPGQGLTLSLSVDTVLSRVRSVQLPSWATEPVDFSGLSNLDWFTFLAATLQDGGELIAELYHNTEIVVPTPRVVQTATITFPIQTVTNTTAAILSGSGFVTGVGFPNAAVGEPMIQTLTFKFDGDTIVPSWAEETT